MALPVLTWRYFLIVKLSNEKPLNLFINTLVLTKHGNVVNENFKTLYFWFFELLCCDTFNNNEEQSKCFLSTLLYYPSQICTLFISKMQIKECA